MNVKYRNTYVVNVNCRCMNGASDCERFDRQKWKQSETRRPLPSICIACSFVWVSCVGRLL